MTKPINRLQRLLFTGSTALLRWWFGLAEIGFAFFLLHVTTRTTEYRVTMQVADPWLWFAVFAFVGCTRLWGSVTSKYSKATLVVEGFMGVAAWSALSLSSMLSTGTFGAIGVASICAFYILMRYPEWR